MKQEELKSRIEELKTRDMRYVEHLEHLDLTEKVSNVLNDTKAYIKIARVLGIEPDNNSMIFHEIEEFIVEKFHEMQEEMQEQNKY